MTEWHEGEVLFAIDHNYVQLFVEHRAAGLRLAVALRRVYGRLNLVVDECYYGEPAHLMPCLEPAHYARFRVQTARSEGDGLPRCHIMPVKLSYLGGRCHHAVLPFDHELPWPVARDCESYMRKEELLAECMHRRDSAVRAGLRPKAPPGSVTRLLTPEMRVALFSPA